MTHPIQGITPDDSQLYRVDGEIEMMPLVCLSYSPFETDTDTLSVTVTL